MQHRGGPYLEAYLKDPAKFYDEQRHRRLVPKQDMTGVEIADLVSFLDWVSKVVNQGWPPRPTLGHGFRHPSDGCAAGRHGVGSACTARWRRTCCFGQEPDCAG